MKKFISILCLCAISLVGTVSSDVMLEKKEHKDVSGIPTINQNANIELLGNSNDSYVEEYDMNTKKVSVVEDTKESENASTSRKISISSYIPTKYADRKYNTVSKDQKDYSTCWGFSTIACIEANLIKKGLASNNINLSEAGLIYFTYNKASDNTNDTVKIISNKNYLYMGGNKTITMHALASGSCLVNESVMPYSKLTTNTKYSNAYGHYSDYMVREIGLIQANDRNSIKNAIYTYGAVNASLYQDEKNKNYNLTYKSSNQKTVSNTNHAVTIIGWDDNFSKDKFVNKPSKNGAWLVKNSWGASWGDKGCYWVSYEDASLNNKEHNVAYYNMDKKDKDFLNIYEHDGTYSASSLSDIRYQANVFTSKQNEMISDVLFYTLENNISYELSIYTDIKDHPSDGKLAYARKGTLKYAGCHNIDLKKALNIKKGTKYSVVIKLEKSDGGLTDMSIDYSAKHDGWLQYVTKANKGESYYKYDDSCWIDLGVNLNANCRIKVYTKKGYNVSVSAQNATSKIYNIKVNNIGASTVDVKHVITNTNMNSTEVIDYSSENANYTWLPTSEGKYEIMTYIKDKTTDAGYVYTNTVSVSNLVGYTPTVTTKVNNSGIIVTATTKSSKDNTGNVSYYYNVFDSKNKIVRTKQWCKSNTYNFYAPGVGTYLLRCYIKDETGMIIKKDKTLVFKNISVTGLKATKTKLTKGTRVQVSATASNGIGNLKYYLRVFKVVNSKKVLVANTSSYTYSNKINWKPSSAGTYYLKIYVKDAKGTIKTKEIKCSITSKDIK